MKYQVSIMWKLFLLLAINNALAMVRGQTFADNLSSERDAEITLYKISPADEFGVYKYAFATSNGINVQAAGSPLEAIGIYSYIAPDGQTIEVRYIADELGFHAVGRHLPRPHPIPEYVLRSIEYIRTHPNAENRSGSWKPK